MVHSEASASGLTYKTLGSGHFHPGGTGNSRKQGFPLLGFARV
jgi:hypothetical protein